MFNELVYIIGYDIGYNIGYNIYMGTTLATTLATTSTWGLHWLQHLRGTTSTWELQMATAIQMASVVEDMASLASSIWHLQHQGFLGLQNGHIRQWTANNGNYLRQQLWNKYALIRAESSNAPLSLRTTLSLEYIMRASLVAPCKSRPNID